ncbi:MAG: CRISPR-associated endoribonuclease Cas6 [Clostridia bacterium]|nr:CRISPR-associated endoribonuclease Cas6 [Clostridia bacterium]MDD4572343.1 CRISPR-associated endoribonuclease Cas6 [Clostridia bacterium]
MRFSLVFKLIENQVPLDIRPVVLSFFKRALTKYDGGRYLAKYYGIGAKKPFTFALDLGKCSFTKEFIDLADKKIILNFSTSSSQTGIIFYNAFLSQKGKPFPLAMGNSITLANVYMQKHKAIVSEQILCRFVAPLCLRKHEREGNKDYYLTWEDEIFNQELVNTVKEQAKKLENWDNTEIKFEILSVRPKKTVVKHHGQSIPVTIGTFVLKSNISLLSELYLSGIGSRKSAGFGYFNIIGQGGRAESWVEK